MSFDEVVIDVQKVSKCFEMYENPSDRLKQMLIPRIQRAFRRPVSHYAKQFWALDSVDFQVKRGETVGIIGKNGSGKSTLLQIICGTLIPTSGNIRTDGRVAALLELGSGFDPEFTGRQNVYMNASILGLTTQEVDERFDAIASFADIGDFLDQPVRAYSSGMMVRLAFAVAINVDPQILIIDEALSVGDELFQRKCFSRIEDIKATGATILFVSHSGASIIELCDRAILLDSAQKILEGYPKEVVGQYQKLLYSTDGKRGQIREQLLRAKTRVDAPKTPDIVVGDSVSVGPAHYFDSQLVSQSTLPYESNGAVINAPEILSLQGEKVNCLISGNTYRYCYSVRFDKTAINVAFGMMIKTVSGVELGGFTTGVKIEERIGFLQKNTVVRVEFRFVANLNAGSYYLNAGVTGKADADDTYLHRVLDFYMFRVIHDGHAKTTGMVSFLAAGPMASCFVDGDDLLDVN
ncbi:MAG: ABC transporter ATP-binding protein [Halioglobus sp.]|nr:ABC transporter ATP-binding protein [Halioglobus sp.]